MIPKQLLLTKVMKSPIEKEIICLPEILILMLVHYNLKAWGRSYHENTVEPDQTAPEEQSDQGLHCLPLPKLFCDNV